ncbi:MAG TPA: FAD:protein FMN transferase [Candidatus Saccharimonadales bacterium]|nr:FAD:protein FMN transferase [Candidatus Saccharimonadales bacterium]
MQQTKHALGSDAVLTVVATSGDQAKTLLQALWQQVERFEASFSRFRIDSELSRFNAQAGSETVISNEFYDLLVASRKLSLDTKGAYNPFILPALQQAGYIGSWPEPQKANSKLDFSNRRIYPISSLTLTKGRARIPADAALDFGGIGKGYLLDQLADYAVTKHVKGYWFSLGGDIVCQGYNEAGEPWHIGIQAAVGPAEATAYAANIHGGRLAVATSGVTKRHGTKSGHSWHHLIDPRTGLPTSSDILTATVVGPRAVYADVYASCAVLLGSTEAQKFLRHKGVSALLQNRFTTSHSQSLQLVGKGITLESGAKET